MIIAIVGAESTGKTALASALAAKLGAVAVPERLRAWCDEAGRTPRADEQFGILETQARSIEAATRRAAVVVADTTPLQTAVYSDFVFGDRSHYPAALDWQRRHVATTLLTGLDLPWRPDGLQRDGPQVRGPVDRLLRAALDGAGLPYAVVYGSGDARLDAAARACGRHASAFDDAAEGGLSDTVRPPVRWQALCAECLDAACEHRARQG